LTKRKKAADPTAAERKQRERDRKAELGLVRRDVWAHPDDWPQIRELEQALMAGRERSGK
jgi:Fic family protein